MRVHGQSGSIPSEPTTTTQPSGLESLCVRESLVPRLGSGSEDSYSEDEDEAYLFDIPPSRTPNTSITEDLASQARELARIVLKMFLFTISLFRDRSKGNIFWSLPERSRKRLRTFFSDKNAEIGREPETVEEEVVVGGTSTIMEHHFVCPYYLRQKERHLSCLTGTDMREIRDVKRHLWAAHRQPSYCPICYETFSLTEDWENHIRLKFCTSSGKPRPEGISVLQMQQLAQRADPRASREVQWLLIWEIVFPGLNPPSLETISGEVETVVWVLRDFWSANGNQILFRFLTEQQQRSPQLQNNKLTMITLGSLVLDRVIDQLVASFRQDEGGG
ncbi:hypothetical protein F5Y12DRAFT_759130 [Xylaria sp. FL1777]|nr:hypothetical protein F5Y12DRAFT_759130 [Xylaria sp. FL1777]